MLMILFLLLAGHALADFALQPSEMAIGKSRFNPNPILPWPYWLTAHAFIHGGVVAFITGLWWLGWIEVICHWAIDYGKCEGWYGIHKDQFLHILCKFAYFFIILGMAT